MNSDGMMITGARWFYNGRIVSMGFTTNAPYQINNTTRNILFIDQSFRSSDYGGTYTCSPNDILYSTSSDSDEITLNANGEF